MDIFCAFKYFTISVPYYTFDFMPADLHTFNILVFETFTIGHVLKLDDGMLRPAKLSTKCLVL
jgi:hypothetical protein